MKFFPLFRAAQRSDESELVKINRCRDELRAQSDEQLKSLSASLRQQAPEGVPDGEFLIDCFAVSSEACRRVLGQRPFDVQILGALAMNHGKIAEMQTGEGKTLTAVMTVYANALCGRGVHVLTANDYLAQRDATWMGGIYEFLGLSCGYVDQTSTRAQRRAAYAADVTYATANEAGFDYLRDNLALSQDELVQRGFAFALIDEIDSILIDEARIPLVIAGGAASAEAITLHMAYLARKLRLGADYFIDDYARNVALTDAGVAKVEASLQCANLFDAENLMLLTAIQDALHAQALLRRDVDYVVKNNSIELVDEFKGRIAQNRRWPAGLQTAIEAKEGVALKKQGHILGSITLQNLAALYTRVCGMTGTAATQAAELREVYGLQVAVIPTNQPMIRVDHPDRIFRDRRTKEAALVDEIVSVHKTGRPILVGTASVADSERLSDRLRAVGVPHQVLNARNDEQEARIIAQAGASGAVTISTNMAGRGTDIQLGGDPPQNREQVLGLGGLYVIGANKHESRRIDNQLKGRAGRQGDPGSSRFFISLQDDLLVRYGINKILAERDLSDENFTSAIASVQSTIEDQNLQIRRTLWKYEGIIEHQRKVVQARRREILLSDPPNRTLLLKIDELWADYLAGIADLRGGIHWVSWGGKDPLQSFLREVVERFAELEECLDEADAGQEEEGTATPLERGATWTYVISDQPFGSLTDRMLEGLRRKVRLLYRR